MRRPCPSCRSAAGRADQKPGGMTWTPPCVSQPWRQEFPSPPTPDSGPAGSFLPRHQDVSADVGKGAVRSVLSSWRGDRETGSRVSVAGFFRLPPARVCGGLSFSPKANPSIFLHRLAFQYLTYPVSQKAVSPVPAGSEVTRTPARVRLPLSLSELALPWLLHTTQGHLACGRCAFCVRTPACVRLASRVYSGRFKVLVPWRVLEVTPGALCVAPGDALGSVLPLMLPRSLVQPRGEQAGQVPAGHQPLCSRPRPGGSLHCARVSPGTSSPVSSHVWTCVPVYLERPHPSCSPLSPGALVTPVGRLVALWPAPILVLVAFWLPTWVAVDNSCRWLLARVCARVWSRGSGREDRVGCLNPMERFPDVAPPAGQPLQGGQVLCPVVALGTG